MIKFSKKRSIYFFLFIMISLFCIFPFIKASTQQTNQITCTSPTSNTSLKPGDNTYITWSTEGGIEIIKIDIYKGSVLKYDIEETNNDGSFLWRVPYSIEPGPDWRVKVSDYFDEGTYDLSDYFEITQEFTIIDIFGILGILGIIGIIVLGVVGVIILIRINKKK
ncbi:MAG: Ser-Thr-rich GPI-anchored membrane family protein [Promethearchaeota archaeon]